MSSNEQNNRPGKRLLWNAAVIICLAVFVISAAAFGRTFWQSRQEDQTFQELVQIAEANTADAKTADQSGLQEGADQTGGTQAPRRDYAAIKALNQDFAAWLTIEDTPIDYPVMATPEDMQYYIHRDFYGKDSVSGTLFLGDDFSTESMSMIIYGHNMKNGTMFGELDRYARDSYWREHPVIRLSTVDEDREYEIFAAFQTRLLYEGEEGFAYYAYTGDLSQEEYEEFVEQAKAMTPYDTGITPEYGEQLVMLSTCSYHTENGRFVVVGREKIE